MRKFLLGLTLAVGAVLTGAMPALADGGTMPAPGSGPAFGQCISMMVSAGAMAGPMIGQCASAMAHGVCACAGMM